MNKLIGADGRLFRQLVNVSDKPFTTTVMLAFKIDSVGVISELQ